ncbi:MAG TPA: hypothetical protein PKA27_14760 [Fimbriimonadaceae bacterium]|nr:hypothetical protein [Fimbriimonadaceae bacterium]
MDKNAKVSLPVAIGVAVVAVAVVGGISYAMFGQQPQAEPTSVNQAANQIDPQQLADQKAADAKLQPREESAN